MANSLHDILLNLNQTTDDVEQRLRSWAKPPSQSEIDKCDRSERMVKQAILNDPELKNFDINCYSKGSFARRTNIPSDSDVDVGVLKNDLYFNTYPPGTTRETFGFSEADYFFEQYKRDVATAVARLFGQDKIEVGNKAITVHENTCRVDADVVPQVVHRHFYWNGSEYRYIEGVAISDGNGGRIYNFPKQDYANGVEKNSATNQRFKAMTRVLKNLRGEMKQFESASAMASYLIECLVYNVPNSCFGSDQYRTDLKMVLKAIAEFTERDELCSARTEVNGVKLLFHPSQSWTRQQAHQFAVDAFYNFEALLK